jgi:outer membrane protein assembly complex protein YaeT
MWRTSSAALILAVSLSQTSYAQEQRIKVTGFDIQGVSRVDKGELHNALATRKSSWIPWGQDHYFNRRQFEADLKRIQVFYTDRGFPDAKVSSFDIRLNDAQDEVSLTVVVDEGEPVLVQEIEYSGFDVLGPRRLDRLKANAPLKEQQPRDRAALQMTRERALDQLRDTGYPYAQVRVTDTPAGNQRQRIITYQAEPGPLSYFGPIEIVGNTSVSDDVIRRHLLFRPGRRFRLGLVQESQRRLYGLELFEFVNVERVVPEGRSVPAAEVPTRVTVTEGDHRKLNFGLGYGSEERARVEANWRHVNFFGGARTAGVEARYSRLDRGVRLNLEQPYLFSPRTVLQMSGEAWRSAEPAYRLDTAGARLTVQRRFARGGPVSTSPRVSTLSVGLIQSWEDYEISDEALADLSFRPTLIALRLDPRTGTGGGLLSAIDVDYSRNTTGNLLDAKRGYVFNAHFEAAGRWLSADFKYQEYSIEGRHYLTVANWFVLANRLKLSTIDGEQTEDDISVPFFKRYFLGGSSSLRGWGRFEVSPLSGSGLPIGGHSMLEASTEFRVPVWGNLSLVLFADAGNAWADKWTFDANDLLVDVGPGLRYNTPIGPVRFDIGYQLTRLEGLLVKGEPEKRRFRMHFSIGQAF